MKDRWLEDIKEKISDFEMESPDGLWESIKAEMPIVENSTGKKPTSSSWRKISYAAAVLALLLGLSGFLFWIGKVDTVYTPTLEQAQVLKDSQTIKNSQVSEENKSAVSAPKKFAQIQRKDIPIRSEEKETELSIPDIISSSPIIISVAETDKISGVSPKSEEEMTKSVSNQISADPKDTGEYEVVPDVYRSATKPTKFSLAASLSATGAGDSMSGNGSGTNVSGKKYYMDADNSSEVATRMGGLYIDPDILSKFHSQEVFDHKLPLRFCVDLSWSLNRFLSLEAGLAYTLLNSDIRYGRIINQGKARQSLHYVGIPVAIRYVPFRLSNFEFYLRGGVLAEKCVAGDITTQTLSSTPYYYSGYSDRPFQFSINAALGVQYDITRTCGVFVQPELGYYFNDGSSLRTIYKEHPLNFNLNIGFRFSFQK